MARVDTLHIGDKVSVLNDYTGKYQHGICQGCKEGKIYLKNTRTGEWYSIDDDIDYWISYIHPLYNKPQIVITDKNKAIPSHVKKYATGQQIKRLARFDTNSYTGVKDGTEITLHYIPSAGAYKISY